MKQNNFYITTPIYYPSGQPHIGHAYSSILADVIARFMRNDNHKVHFLTGTDEHGLKIQKSAEKEGLKPLLYCDRLSKTFKDLIGQEVVAETIYNSIKYNRLANAYLFTGIRGVGKTTIARIVAKSLNCSKGIDQLCIDEPCENCKEISN